MYLNKKKLTIGLIILLCFIAGSLIFVYKVSNPAETSEGMIYDSNAVDWDDTVTDEEVSDGIAIPGYASIYFPKGETEIQMTLPNPEENTCLFKYELYINDESEPIASTDLIEPGKAVETITLTEALSEGNYKLQIKILTYTEDFVPLNNALVKTDLTVE